MIKLFDELDERWDENGYDKTEGVNIWDEFDELFDDSEEKNQYVVLGYHQLWNGTFKGNSTKAYNSIKDAILESQQGFGICYTQVYEGENGKLCFNTIHHDGTNRQEILQLTSLGKEMYHDKFYVVDKILENGDATKDVGLAKRLGVA